MLNYKDLISRCQNTHSTVQIMGRTELGYPIPILKKGNHTKKILLIGGIHAREFVSSYLLLELLKNYDPLYEIHVVPMLNIDGCFLSANGINFFKLDKSRHQFLIDINGGSYNFGLFKANIRGVDLNKNFDADFGQGTGVVFSPSPEGYVGEFANSEKETRAIIKLLSYIDYSSVICYHSKGEEVYYNYKTLVNHEKEAKIVAGHLNYTAKTTPTSFGGIKDFFISKYQKLGLTIEVGSNSLTHPISIAEVEKLKQQHAGVLSLYERL